MEASFVLSAAQVSQLDHLNQPELAVVGRSNVGKSSLLGRLMGQPHLVRSSKTPGRTQLLNVFRLDGLHLIDLPGVGYAKVSKQQQSQLQQRIWSYVQQRQPLQWLMLLVDGRRDGPNPDEWQLYQIAMQRQLNVYVILHKADQINKAKRVIQAKRWARAFDCQLEHLLWCSSTTGEGFEQLTRWIKHLVKQSPVSMTLDEAG